LSLNPSSGISKCVPCIISNQEHAPGDSQATAPWGSNTVSVFTLPTPLHPFPPISHRTAPASMLVCLWGGPGHIAHCVAHQEPALRHEPSFSPMHSVPHISCPPARPPTTHPDMRLIPIGFHLFHLIHHAKVRLLSSVRQGKGPHGHPTGFTMLRAHPAQLLVTALLSRFHSWVSRWCRISLSDPLILRFLSMKGPDAVMFPLVGK
jgi:hypothetical protein